MSYYTGGNGKDIPWSEKVRCRVEGFMHSEGTLQLWVNRDDICQIMDWDYFGWRRALVDETIGRLERGEAVQLENEHGRTTFYPLDDDEDWRAMPKSGVSLQLIQIEQHDLSGNVADSPLIVP